MRNQRNYWESVYIMRGESLYWIVPAFVTEKQKINTSDGDGVNYVNIYTFEVWRGDYTPKLGDLVYYNRTLSGVMNEPLVLRGIIENKRGRKLEFQAVRKDFIGSYEVIQRYTENLTRRTYTLTGVSDGYIVQHLPANTIPDSIQIQFMANFYLANGTQVYHIQFERVNNRSIRLIMDTGVTFTGTVTVERR